VGFVVDKVVLGQVFSKYFGFPCQSSFHQILHHHNHPGQGRVEPVWSQPPTMRKKKLETKGRKVLTLFFWKNPVKISPKY
jgi:hypothetical protein